HRYRLAFPLVSSHYLCNDTSTTEFYTLSLHDALPICGNPGEGDMRGRLAAPGTGGSAMSAATSAGAAPRNARVPWVDVVVSAVRSEEHTSELQSRENLVCRLLLEKKKINNRPR